MNEPILEIRDLCKSHTGKPPYFFARIDSLRLWPGQALGITGASGCGKSTLLEMLALLTRPDRAGRFILRTDGAVCDLGALWCHDTRRLASIRREHMGFVHQAGGLYPFLTAEENIRLPLLLNGMDADEAIFSRVQELLDFLNLRHVADSLPENLSYGERQRTAIARALVHRPRLILADEPTSALDPDSARNAMRLLRDGALRYGGGLLVVSHDHALLDAAGIPPLAMRPEVDADGDSRRYVLTQPTESRPIIDASPSRAHDSPSSAPPGFAARARLACYLAWRDFRHEYALSFCAVLAFAAALAPIMVLGGLRNGVIATLTQRLLNNPAALSVNPYGSSRYTEKDLAELAALPSVTFLVPLTRTLASTVRIPRPNRPPVTVDVIPTVEGDPLLLRYASVPPEGAAVITQDLARSLPQAAVGQSLDLVVSRRFQGREQQVVCTVRIHAILPDAADWKAHIYLPLPLLLDMERYRDGLAVPARDWPGNARQEDEERVYAGFRMYVDGLDAVIPMRDELKRRGIDAYTFAREVETIQSLRNALTLITLLVGCVTLVGMGFSLASLAVANVRRKARFFAQGRLMGLEKGQLLSLPLIQLALTAVLAATCSMLLYACVAVLLDMAASPWLEQGESACRLAGAHIALLYAGSFLLACLCGAAACRNLLSLQPAEVLRRDA